MKKETSDIYQHCPCLNELIGFTEEELYERYFNDITYTQTMTTEIAYISGKITGLVDLNIPKFQKAEAKLIQMGFKTVNPHNIEHNHDKKWNSYMKKCLAALQGCDLVVVLDDWQKSRGACIEIWTAEWVDIPVFDLKTFTPVKLSWWIKIKIILNLI
jgi:hypothetical protein